MTEHEKTSVSDGLAKMHQAAELISAERIEQLAEQARRAAMQNRKPHKSDESA